MYKKNNDAQTEVGTVQERLGPKKLTQKQTKKRLHKQVQTDHTHWFIRLLEGPLKAI